MHGIILMLECKLELDNNINNNILYEEGNKKTENKVKIPEAQK